ncbi:hypothetical protein [Glycomyces tenuis]|uniref:hypothetical protein n=1 Tax=Glycomyces tenuis TaxID=58116 RepID=UPI00047C37B8|nr:hypothetical protein [Glycomyces tenuis]
MLAKKYGYWVSERAAADHPATMQWIQGGARKVRRVGWFVFTGGIALSIGGAAYAWNTDISVLLMVAMLVLPFPFAGLAILLTQRRRRMLKKLPQLTEHPWQAWPCQVASDPTIRLPREVRRPGLLAARITLLDPDQRPVRRFHGAMWMDTWQRTPDGFGVLWISGDLRTRIAVAEPGGAPFSFMRPIPEDGASSDIQDKPTLLDAAAEAAIREAGAAATRHFLNSMGW